MIAMQCVFLQSVQFYVVKHEYMCVCHLDVFLYWEGNKTWRMFVRVVCEWKYLQMNFSYNIKYKTYTNLSYDRKETEQCHGNASGAQE